MLIAVKPLREVGSGTVGEAAAVQDHRMPRQRRPRVGHERVGLVAVPPLGTPPVRVGPEPERERGPAVFGASPGECQYARTQPGDLLTPPGPGVLDRRNATLIG